MFNLIAAGFGIINIVLILVIAPYFAHKHRLNFWKEAFSHLGDRKDTHIMFDVGIIIFMLFQLFFCTAIALKLNLYQSIILLILSVVFGIVPGVISASKNNLLHTLFAIFCGIFAFLFSLFINYRLIFMFNEAFGIAGMVFSVGMSIGAGYIYFHKKGHHLATAIGEIILFIPIGLWNLTMVMALLNPN